MKRPDITGEEDCEIPRERHGFGGDVHGEWTLRGRRSSGRWTARRRSTSTSEQWRCAHLQEVPRLRGRGTGGGTPADPLPQSNTILRVMVRATDADPQNGHQARYCQGHQRGRAGDGDPDDAAAEGRSRADRHVSPTLTLQRQYDSVRWQWAKARSGKDSWQHSTMPWRQPTPRRRRQRLLPAGDGYIQGH